MSARSALTILLALAAAWLADGWAFAHLHVAGTAGQDWHRLLRVAGFWPTWLVVGAALGRVQERWDGAVRLALASGLAGLLAEGLKLVIRRERPGPLGEVIFRPWSEAPWHTSGLGMPSSHTAVAFGAAFVLARLQPRVGPVVLALAAGCAATRVLERAHFLSDVVAAAGLGWLVALVVARIGPRQGRSEGQD